LASVLDPFNSGIILCSFLFRERTLKSNGLVFPLLEAGKHRTWL